jgi:predicted transcriptional regulator
LLQIEFMSLKAANARILFGIRVKQLRQAQQRSFVELSAASGLSVSYLNEIEKGKKYPREDKLRALASSLDMSVEELTNLEADETLLPVMELLESNFLSELPLDLFGIELSKVVEMIASAPKRVGAFISTLVELSRNYALREENFYFGALRSYLELHNNYFEDIEAAVEAFATQHQLPTQPPVPVTALAQLLELVYGYELVYDGLDAHPELQELRSVFVPETKKLLLNSRLNDRQKAFQFGKELGFQYLQLSERANTSSLLRVHSFEEVLSHFKAGYFSAALLLNRIPFRQDVERFLNQPHWNGEAFTALLHQYQASPEMLFQRLTNLLPHEFGLKKLFFLRFLHTPSTGRFRIDKELHLDRRHHPQGSGLSEHYCRRWLSISLLQDLQQMQAGGIYTGAIVGAQRSRYFGTDDEYLCITLARPAYPSPDHNVSVTIGILIDNEARQRIRFLDDPAIGQREVNKTCERCPISNCAERAAPSTIVEARNKRRRIEEALGRL